MTIEEANLAFVRRYYASFDPGAPSQPIESFYEPDAVQVEYPNRFLPNGATRDVAAIRLASERGRKLMASQRFELLSAVATGNLVAVEALWEGTLAVPVGDLPVGTVMKARFAQFFEMRNGRIHEQRNYDCFEPW
jgi:ketosteroid isomerase-like protein